MRNGTLLGLTVLLALGGCGGDTRDDNDNGSAGVPTSASGETGTPPPTSDSGTTMQPGGTATGDSTGPDGDDTGEPVFDVGSEPPGTTTGPTTDECAKVDILYIIDNSPSMYEEQQTLIANFATFVADMQSALIDVDSYHVGVITTDDYRGGGIFDDGDDSVNESFPECQALGGLVVEAQAGSCLPFAGGDNFITDADDLATKFNCVANVGENGDSDEMVGDALIQLLASQEIPNAVSTCNSGFIRDDALLVIVILTDENDSSNTGPSDWFDAVVAAKGVADNAVVLSLIWEDDAAGCTDAFSEANGSEIIEFTQMFENHSLGNICDNSYAGFFSGTLPLIEAACAEFEPEG